MRDANGTELRIGDKVMIEAIVVDDLGEAIEVELKDELRFEFPHTVMIKSSRPKNLEVAA